MILYVKGFFSTRRVYFEIITNKLYFKKYYLFVRLVKLGKRAPDIIDVQCVCFFTIVTTTLKKKIFHSFYIRIHNNRLRLNKETSLFKFIGDKVKTITVLHNYGVSEKYVINPLSSICEFLHNDQMSH